MKHRTSPSTQLREAVASLRESRATFGQQIVRISILILLIASATVMAGMGPYQFSAEIKGTNKMHGNSNLDGYTCVIIGDPLSENPVDAVVSVPSKFGRIDLCVLLIIDPEGNQLGRIHLNNGHPLEQKTEYAFTLTPDLIKNSFLVVYRQNRGLKYIARFHLGTFSIEHKWWLKNSRKNNDHFLHFPSIDKSSSIE